MNYLTQTLPNFQVNRDGQPDPDYLPTKQPIFTHFTGLLAAFRLQLHLLTYDTLHRTQYRSIRNTLIQAKRNTAFEAKIGLVKK